MLPTSPVTKVALYWLESYDGTTSAPIGIRYLHLRKRLNNPAAAEMRSQEAQAYESAFPDIAKRFAAGLTSFTFDVVVECPSCSPYANQFADIAGQTHPKATRVAFVYDCIEGNRKDAARGAFVSELEAAMSPRTPLPRLDRVGNALIVDDLFNDGDTAAAVVHKLWAGGLNRDASIHVAVPLRVMPSEPQTKYDFRGVLGTSPTGQQGGNLIATIVGQMG